MFRILCVSLCRIYSIGRSCIPSPGAYAIAISPAASFVGFVGAVAWIISFFSCECGAVVADAKVRLGELCVDPASFRVAGGPANFVVSNPKTEYTSDSNIAQWFGCNIKDVAVPVAFFTAVGKGLGIV